jgi:translation initiation factor IF-2
MNKQPLHNNIVVRPPVVCIMGHIDHGKSTLLDYIRKTNITEKEAGGITQHLGSYEVIHKTKEGKENKITFLDTPGHAAFAGIRERGVAVADIAILIVSGEDGVKPQTMEAFRYIQTSGIPFIIAITKIDKPAANLERAKQSLMENEIYMEGYGGTAPCIGISSKTGEGIDELLDLILLLAELQELKMDTNKNAEGFIIETSVEKARGIGATLIVKNGTLAKGMTITCGDAIAPIRLIEDFLGKPIEKATPSSPIRVIGWSKIPSVGALFSSFEKKRDAEEAIEESKRLQNTPRVEKSLAEETRTIIPIVIKADAAGTIEAILHEIQKLPKEKVLVKIVSSGIGDISEKDLKSAIPAGAHLIGFNVRIDSPAQGIIDRSEVKVQVFTIIYKLMEWLEQIIVERTPKVSVEENTGKAKILKVFSKVKDKQILGGKVQEGVIGIGNEVKIIRRENEIGKGRIRELQKQKVKADEIQKDTEFGAMIESKIEIAAGDRIEAFTVIEK